MWFNVIGIYYSSLMLQYNTCKKISNQRIWNKHLVGTVIIDTLLVLTEFCPLVAEKFTDCSVVEVWMLLTYDAALFLTEYHKRVHRTTNVNAIFGHRRLKQKILPTLSSVTWTRNHRGMNFTDDTYDKKLKQAHIKRTTEKSNKHTCIVLYEICYK